MYLYEIIKHIEEWYKEESKLTYELYLELVKNGMEKEEAEKIAREVLNKAFYKTWRF